MRIGRYEVLSHLATGGMAQIYLARQSGLGSFERHVVLKTILRERASDRRFVTMFLDEAKLAATLNHQNVAQVFEVDQADGAYFMAMEYVHGENARTILETTIRRGWTIPLELAVTIVSGAAAGLHHAHERRGKNGAPLNIVHRDVSPANIMVGYDGSVKVLDFGIAKAEERATVTVGGTIKGKYGYMAPEQCRGKPIDRRSDIFALGIVLYELTTLRRAFKGVDDFETMKLIVGGELVPPSQLVHGFSRELEAIILTAMATDPAARFQTAQELTEALDAFMVRSALAGSNTAMSRFMVQLFGSRKEPWIEGAAAASEPPAEITVVSPHAPSPDDPDPDDDDDNNETLISSNRQDVQRALDQLSAPARPSQRRPVVTTPSTAIPVPAGAREPSGRVAAAVARESSGRAAAVARETSGRVASVAARETSGRAAARGSSGPVPVVPVARESSGRAAAVVPVVPVVPVTRESSGRAAAAVVPVAREPSGRVASAPPRRPSARLVQDRPSLPFAAVAPPEQPAAPAVAASHASADHLAITAVGPIPSAPAPADHAGVPATGGAQPGHAVVPPTPLAATSAHAPVPGAATGQLTMSPSRPGRDGWDPAPGPALSSQPPIGGASDAGDLRIRSDARWVILAIVAVLVILAILVMILDA